MDRYFSLGSSPISSDVSGDVEGVEYFFSTSAPLKKSISSLPRAGSTVDDDVCESS